MITKTAIITSHITDPWLNLAAEEYMLDRTEKGRMTLFVWQNHYTVVIGKNQNAWKECNVNGMDKDGIKLARRLSGGGAVYHDRGNLNFTFLTDRENYDLHRQAHVILRAVQMAGINAEMSGRNDLVVNDRKFSGNAFCFRRDAAFHHGTILVDSDLEALSYYLQVPKEKIVSKGVESVRSRVTNLADLKPGLTMPRMKECLVQAFIEEYGEPDDIDEGFDHMDPDEIKFLYDKYSSWDWRFGEAPKFDIELENKFPWGGIQIYLTLDHGKITGVKAYSDSMDEGFASLLPGALTGIAFNSQAMADELRKLSHTGTSGFVASNGNIFGDIADWMQEKGF